MSASGADAPLIVLNHPHFVWQPDSWLLAGLALLTAAMFLRVLYIPWRPGVRLASTGVSRAQPVRLWLNSAVCVLGVIVCLATVAYDFSRGISLNLHRMEQPVFRR